jgi:ferrochelatase
VSDCLETIEEIGIEGKEDFIKNGGENFNRVECLNDDDEWVNSLSEIIKENILWPIILILKLYILFLLLHGFQAYFMW